MRAGQSVAAGATKFSQKRKHRKTPSHNKPVQGEPTAPTTLFGAGHSFWSISFASLASYLTHPRVGQVTGPTTNKPGSIETPTHSPAYTSTTSIYSFDAPFIYLCRLIPRLGYPSDRVVAPLTPLPSHCFGVNREPISHYWHPYHDRYPPATFKHINVYPE